MYNLHYTTWHLLWYIYLLYFPSIVFSLYSIFPFAEAACATAVRAAKGFVEDVGKAAASKSVGLLRLANCSEQNAERDCHSLLVGKYELALPIQKTELGTGCGFSVPVLRLRDWAQFLVDGNHTHILVGLKKPHWEREEAILRAFWKNFRCQHPTHPVFEQAERGQLCLGRTFPMVFHGDEGRGRKHSAYLVCNMHSVLGRGLRKETKLAKQPWCKMCPNYHGSTMTSRFLLVALPKVLYTGENDQVWTDVMQFVSDEVLHMFSSGVADALGKRGRFHMVLTHISGDWPFLADSGCFERSFRNSMKQKNQQRQIGICHLCAAGRDCDFEQLNTVRPEWLATMYTLRMHADGCQPSPLEKVPHVPGELAALWSFDTFHTMHLGVCKSFLASALALLSDAQPESTIDGRFSRLSSRYLEWCKAARQRPWVSKLSKELFGWISRTMFPNGTWHKGALSSTLMTWFQHLYETEGASWNPMLQEAGAACVACNSFLQALYNAEAWLEPTEARRIASFGREFLTLYTRLARVSLENGLLLFILQPKHHSLHHLVLYLHYGSQRGAVLNCLCFSTQACEDFVGRPSRLSRRVTPKPLNCSRRVLERYLQNAYSQWVAAGYIVPSSGKKKW